MTILDTVIANHDAAGRPADCAIRIWAAQQKPILDAIKNPTLKAAREVQLRAQLLAHADWKPTWSYQGILAVKDYPSPQKGVVQLQYFNHIKNNGGDAASTLVNGLLQKENATPGTLAPGVAKLMQVWLDTNGTNPKGVRLPGLAARLKRVYADAPDP
jgi:hypothetical protein